MWLKKIAQQLLGRPSITTVRNYQPQSFTSHDDVFQSSDFPHVFLGGQDDWNEVVTKAGQQICAVFDCRDLPEKKVWNHQDLHTTQQQFNAKVAQLEQMINSSNCPIFVHCAAGINRSVSVLAAAISKLTGKPLNSVLAEMKSKRGMISPDDPYYLMALEHCSQTTPEQRQQMFNELAVH